MNSVTFGEQPSDKEEMDAVLKNCPILTQDTIRIVEQANKIISLDTENAEIKAENIRITKLRDHDFEELAELKQQIADNSWLSCMSLTCKARKRKAGAK
jgi:hypothetical protein